MFPAESEKLISLPFHDHPLSCEEVAPFSCQLRCMIDGVGYRCVECNFSLHKDCVDSFLTHPFHCNHFLKILPTASLDNNENDHHCHFCQKRLPFLLARCAICNINMDLTCLAHGTPRTVFQPKHHSHSLTLLPRLVTFTCNACGVESDRNPYVCLSCNMMIHKDCIDLPRVIIINRHDHRISHTFHLGQGGQGQDRDWECGVCRKKIDWVYGAFKCSRCPSYAVHSRCATRGEVWDGIELEDVPEEEEEIEEPYKVINEEDIIHFSHENHILRLHDDENHHVTDMMRCEGCVLAINGDPCYKCVECDFILHKTCASLPRKKRHLLHQHKLALRAYNDKTFTFNCRACQTMSNGFFYDCFEDLCRDYSGSDRKYDVRCSSVSEPFHHDLHPHPLYWTLESSKHCHACHTEIRYPLSCMVCEEYALCMRCATLPRKVKHRCDDHFLSLSQGVGNSSGDLWCDICETKTDPTVCYYTCDDECGVSLHIKCVLGDIYYMKTGRIAPGLEVLPNSGATRPLCSDCGYRCKFPFLMRLTINESVSYLCSIDCYLHLQQGL